MLHGAYESQWSPRYLTSFESIFCLFCSPFAWLWICFLEWSSHFYLFYLLRAKHKFILLVWKRIIDDICLLMNWWGCRVFLTNNYVLQNAWQKEGISLLNLHFVNYMVRLSRHHYCPQKIKTNARRIIKTYKPITARS